jgi:hypothetical protein
MRALQQWSAAKVLVVSGSWILFSVLLAGVRFWLQVRAVRAARPAGSGGIGFVVVNVSPTMLAILFAPPIVLIVAWLIKRWW